MRSLVPIPAGMALFPELLRRAGYYTTNNVKEDYNAPASTRPCWPSMRSRISTTCVERRR